MASDPPSSAPVDLRPLTTSELIDRGFTLYRAHFTVFFLLALLSQLAPLLAQILATTFRLNPLSVEFISRSRTPEETLSVLGPYTGVMLLCQIIAFFFQVVIAYYIADAYLGKNATVAASLRKAWTCLGASIWTCLLNRILIGLTLIFPIIALLAIRIFTSFYPPENFSSALLTGAISLLLLVASLAPPLLVFMRLMVTVPALALEGLPGWKAAKRSFSLVQYDPGLGFFYWGEMRLSFLLLPLFVIEMLLAFFASLPVALNRMSDSFQHGASSLTPPESIAIFSQILMFLAGSFILPLYSIATTLFYYDIRIRREGFDLEFMAQNMKEPK